jgi:hypothetical protein
MDRSTCEEAVKRPGKFQDAPVYVPFYYDAFLDGLAEDGPDGELGFKVSGEDVALFPELSGREWVWIRETDQGFVVECSEPEEDDSEDSEDDGLPGHGLDETQRAERRGWDF